MFERKSIRKSKLFYLASDDVGYMYLLGVILPY